MKTVTEVAHPLVRHHTAIIRDRNADGMRFRHSIAQVATVLAIAATDDLQTESVQIETPVARCEGRMLQATSGLVPILRAGIAMVEPFQNLIPESQVWHLGLYRDEETARPVPYYNKLPEGKPVDVAFVLDPMLATGGSACMAIQSMIDWGVRDIRMVSVIAAPEGITKVAAAFPSVRIWTGIIDERLDERKFIVPGLGDAGDRVFNTD